MFSKTVGIKKIHPENGGLYIFLETSTRIAFRKCIAREFLYTEKTTRLR